MVTGARSYFLPSAFQCHYQNDLIFSGRNFSKAVKNTQHGNNLIFSSEVPSCKSFYMSTIWFSRVQVGKNDYFHYHITLTINFSPLSRCVPLAFHPTSMAHLRPHFRHSSEVNLPLSSNFCIKDLSYKQQKPSVVYLTYL